MKCFLARKNFPKMSGVSIFLPFIFFISFSPFTHTQTIVNTEKLFNADSTRFKFSSELVGNLISGNASVFLLEYSANTAYSFRKNQLMLLSGGELINEEKEIVSNSHFGQFRYSYNHSDWIAPFVFYQLQSNEILLLKRRQLAGVGNRMNMFRYLNSDSLEMFVSRLTFGVMWEEELLNRNDLSLNEVYYTSYIRANTSFILSIALNEKTSFINTTYYQPYFSNFSDFRLLNETNLIFQVTDKLSFSIDFEIRYDSDPPGMLKSSDFNSNFGLLFQI